MIGTSRLRLTGPRRKLWEIDGRFHCPVIGTCLSIEDLEKVVRQSGISLKTRPSDYELHGSLVHMSDKRCRASKNLHKLLEKRYARHIQRITRLEEEADLLAEWNRAKLSGDVPGVFWALVTHPAVEGDLAERLYGENHMLSHISGRSHRAALGRIPALERRVEELEGALSKTRTRHLETVAERDTRIRELEQQLEQVRMVSRQGRLPPVATAGSGGSESDLARERRRADWLEGRVATQAQRLDECTMETEALKEVLAETREDLERAENGLKALMDRFSGEEAGEAKLPDLAGRHIVYVGGRHSLTPHLRSLAQAASGRFTHHDGGVEDNRAGLERLVTKADVVFCPVDCISHDACLRVKRCCKQGSAAFVPLRASSVSSFLAGLHRVALDS